MGKGRELSYVLGYKFIFERGIFEMVKVTLKDGVVKEYEKAVSVLEIAQSISEGLARNAC